MLGKSKSHQSARPTSCVSDILFTHSTVILIPVIGVGMTEGLSNTTNLYPPEEKSKSTFTCVHFGCRTCLIVIPFCIPFSLGSAQIRSHVIVRDSISREPTRHVSHTCLSKDQA